MEMSSAMFIEVSLSSNSIAAVSKRELGFVMVNHHKLEDVRIEKINGG